MKVRTRAIWITATGIIGCGIYSHTFGVAELLGIVFCAAMIDRILGDDKPAAPVPPPLPEAEEVFRVPAGQHLITTNGVKQIRNLLLRHHNMKQTDKDYTDSSMAKETVALVASLNVFLRKL